MRDSAAAFGNRLLQPDDRRRLTRLRPAGLRTIGLLVIATALSAVGQVGYRTPGYVESALPSNKLPPQLEQVGVKEKLGSPINLDLEFVAEDGYPVKLAKYFNQGRPVILNLVYYECPQLCSLILNGQLQTLRDIPWTPGNEYEVVTISIDPREHFGIAREKKAAYMSSFDRPAPGWHFLTDHQGNAKRLAEQVGFGYKYDERIEQYAHPAAIMILTPEGKMARYLYGINYKARDMRFALAEAAEGRMTMAVEKILLFCYQYDPHTNRYVLFATNFMKVGGTLIVGVFGWLWWRLVRADRRRMQRERMA
jgi:protein SCO1